MTRQMRIFLERMFGPRGFGTVAELILRLMPAFVLAVRTCWIELPKTMRLAGNPVFDNPNAMAADRTFEDESGTSTSGCFLAEDFPELAFVRMSAGVTKQAQMVKRLWQT